MMKIETTRMMTPIGRAWSFRGLLMPSCESTPWSGSEERRYGAEKMAVDGEMRPHLVKQNIKAREMSPHSADDGVWYGKRRKDDGR